MLDGIPVAAGAGGQGMTNLIALGEPDRSQSASVISSNASSHRPAAPLIPRAPSSSGSPLCQSLGEDLFLGRVVVVPEMLVRTVERVGVAVWIRGRPAAVVGAAARTARAGAVGGVGSSESPGSGLSEESTVGVGSAAPDARDAPNCPPGLTFAAETICRWTTSDSRRLRQRMASIGVFARGELTPEVSAAFGVVAQLDAAVTLAMMCRARLMRRLPARESRWRCWSAEEASRGAVPLQDAKWLRLAKRVMSPMSPSSRAHSTGRHRATFAGGWPRSVRSAPRSPA
jgi:hypothetical protein